MFRLKGVVKKTIRPQELMQDQSKTLAGIVVSQLIHCITAQNQEITVKLTKIDKHSLLKNSLNNISTIEATGI